MSHPSYPRSMYRLADGGFEYEGRHFAILEVESETEETAAKKDGWVNHPDDCKTADPFDHDGDGKPGGSLPKANAPRKTARKAVSRDARK